MTSAHQTQPSPGVTAPGLKPRSVDTSTLGYGETLGPAPAARTATTASRAALPDAARTTVLPAVELRASNVTLVHSAKTRFVPLKTLGLGGVGEVELMMDEDIQRSVAVKRLRQDRMSDEGVARFVEEIRTVGQLEHPNIVPIHDVGVDEQGRYYFMMKYVDGETLESIIQGLAAGKPEYHQRFPFNVRTQLFVSVLQAIGYAHAHGVIHRDIKPANIMVGRFGEVMVMDWGLARPIRGRELPGVPTGAPDPRGLQTRQDTLMGTPAYMSPEQARGDNEALDERTDIYSLSVVFHELLTLRHYLSGAETLDQVLSGVASLEPRGPREVRHPHQKLPPAELIHFTHRGMDKDPARRFSSVAEMMAEVQDILRGRVRVQCHVTLLKRVNHEAMTLLDSYPRSTTVVAVAAGAAGVWALLHGML